MPYTIDIQHRSALSDVPGGIEEGVINWLTTAGDVGFNESQRKVPEDRGQLGQSGYPPTEHDGAVVWGYAGLPYIAAQEYGTDPFTPPLEPLVEWGNRVGADGGAVWHKIRQEGIDEKRFIRDGVDRQREWMNSNPPDRWLDRTVDGLD